MSVLSCVLFGLVSDMQLLSTFFSTKPRDRLGRTSPKWPILGRVGCKTTAQSINC